MVASPIPHPDDYTIRLDANIVEAVRTAKQHRESAFRQLLQEHREHATFRTISDPVRLEIGFQCSCTGEVQETRVRLCQVKQLVGPAREAVTRLWQNLQKAGSKARKKKAHRAIVKSRALLHRYLTKEQRWQLLAQNSFFITGKDGHEYEICAYWGNNVFRWEVDAGKVYRFCVVADYKTPIPVFDLMLAQKVLLETNPRAFLDVAVTQNLVTKEWWPDGKHIDNPGYVRPEDKLSFRQRMAALNVDNYERQQAEAIQEREEACGDVGQLLMHDLNLNPGEARYDDGSGRSVGFVLNSDYEVVPSFDSPIVVPPLPSEGPGVLPVDACMIKLVTGVPATTYKILAQVQAHFHTVDLFGTRVLIHPETDAAWAAQQPTIWHDRPSILGVKKILDERVPKGKAWYVADGEYVGVVAYWYDEPKVGFCLFNLDGVVIYEPYEDQEEAQAEEVRTQEETRQIFEEIRQAEEARDQAAERILVRTGE